MYNDMSIRERLKEYLEARRNKVLSGEVNCIPTPFPRFSEQFPGIEQGKFYLISGASKASKTQIMNYGYAYDEQHGWYNQYNRPLSKAQQDDVNDKIDKLKKYVAYVAEINKKSGK